MMATEQPYAVCVEPGCGETFVDREGASQHGADTMTPTPEGSPRRLEGVVASGHAFRVVNPTEEEVELNRIRNRVNDRVYAALMEATDALIEDVESERLTKEQVTEELRVYPDFSDAWLEALNDWED